MLPRDPLFSITSLDLFGLKYLYLFPITLHYSDTAESVWLIPKMAEKISEYLLGSQGQETCKQRNKQTNKKLKQAGHLLGEVSRCAQFHSCTPLILSQGFSTGGDFVLLPQGHIVMLETFLIVRSRQEGECASGISWEEAGDVAQHSTVFKAACTTKNNPAQW